MPPNNFRVVYEDIIYFIQKSGGISVYWKMLEDTIFCNKQLVFKELERISFSSVHQNEIASDNNTFLERYINHFLSDMKRLEPFIFHSN